MCCCHSVMEGAGYPKWSKIAPTLRLKIEFGYKMGREQGECNIYVFPVKVNGNIYTLLPVMPKIKIK